MSVVVFAESWEGKFKKGTYEAVNYAAQIAKGLNTEVVAITVGNLSDDAKILGKYGANKAVSVTGDEVSEFNPYTYASAIAKNGGDAKAYVVAGTNNGRMIAPALSIETDAALITNIVEKPSGYNPITVKRMAFSSKGLVDYKANADKVVLSIIPNALGVHNEDGSEASVENGSAPDGSLRNTEVKDVDRVKGKIPLPAAERVVSAGRGMKGPENWNMIEELAEELGAATACSKPVSDMGWRPHSEHVGQTGIAINPNLYVAVGISGAVQHLAGVSNSKTIVVINSDPEAPFFKAADYGIVGDAFEVVPKLTEAIRAFKANN